LVLRQIPVERQILLPLDYRGMKLDCGYRLDVIAYGAILIEVKAVTRVLPIHRAQVLTYLKLTGIRLGLLINFNVEVSDRASTVSSMNDETSVSSVPLW
jgi:GxxExxY protein